MNDPKRVVLAGDWHGRTQWALIQLATMRIIIPEEQEPVLYVLHCGDFGFWPGADFAETVALVARELGIRIWVTPGNHEDYRGKNGVRGWERSPGVHGDALMALRRGARWQWHGRTWLSAGGATSPDRNVRVEGMNWWPEEELTNREVAQIIRDGPAQVLITHDVGSGVTVPFREEWPRFWPESEHIRARQHRSRVQNLADFTGPELWVHGHYHLFHDQHLEMSWGRCHVTGLDMDGGPKNWGRSQCQDARVGGV